MKTPGWEIKAYSSQLSLEIAVIGASKGIAPHRRIVSDPIFVQILDIHVSPAQRDFLLQARPDLQGTKWHQRSGKSELNMKETATDDPETYHARITAEIGVLSTVFLQIIDSYHFQQLSAETTVT